MSRVLIIDDDPNMRVLVRKVLTSLGVTVLEAQDGAEGLSVAVKRDPDLILCDVMMPVMDGMEFLREWASREAISHIPVIMVTSVSEKVRIIDAIKLGACDYIVKPFDPLGFRTKVNKLLRGAAGQHGARTDAPRVERPVVLVASEREEVRRLAADALKAAYEPVTVADGAECVHVVAERHPALLLLSAGIPVIESARLVAKIKESRETAGTRIVLLVSSGGAATLDEAVRAMLDGTIELPASAEALCGAVDRFLGRDTYYFYDRGETTVLRFKARGLAAAAAAREAFDKRFRSELLEMGDAGRTAMTVDLRAVGPDETTPTALLQYCLDQAGSYDVQLSFAVGGEAQVEALRALGVAGDRIAVATEPAAAR